MNTQEAMDYLARIRTLESYIEKQAALILRIDNIVKGKNDETSIAIKDAFRWFRNRK